MTRQFKLVTEKEYELLKNLKGENLEPKPIAKPQVWNSDLPEEVKSMIFQDYMRRILRKKDEDERKPVPVKLQPPPAPTEPEEEPETPPSVPNTVQNTPGYVHGVTRKMQQLNQYLKEQGFGTLDGGLNLGGILLDREEAMGLMRSLADGRVSTSQVNPGALAFLKAQHVPLKFVAARKHGLLQDAKKKWTTLKF